MSVLDDYNKAKKKRLGLTDDEDKSNGGSSTNSVLSDYNRLKAERLAKEEEEEDIAPLTSFTPSATKTESKPWYKSGVFEDGYQIGDVSKHILGLFSDTADDIAPYVVGLDNGQKQVQEVQKQENAATDNSATTQKEDSSHVMNFKIGVDAATRKSIYDANAKRIAEIDSQLAQNESGKTSFWQSSNPIAWVSDKFSDSTKALEEERHKLVEANAKYDRYGNAADLSYDELKAKQAAAKDEADKLHYLTLANQKLISDNTELMAKTQMDDTDHSVYEELQQIASMEDGEEKEKRKAAAIKKMESLGIKSDDYALYSDDDNFSWGTFFNWFGKSFGAGWGSANAAFTRTLDATAGTILKGVGWENNPISSIAKYYEDSYNNLKYDADLYKERLGGGNKYEYGSKLVEGTGAALPAAIMAFATKGQSLTGIVSTSALSTNMAYATGGILQKAGLTLSSMMKNPQYWFSFAQTYGSDYKEAKSKGADDFVASLGATITSLVNAGVEIGVDGGSGIQGLPKKVAEGGSNAILEWVKSSVEEGAEEVVQGVVTNAVARLTHDDDAEIANPEEMLKEFLLGAGVGGLLGGTQIAVQSGTNAVTNAIQQHEARKLTETEQKVFDKIYEERISEESEKGDVSKKRKSEIYDEVLNEMEKGYFSTDTIDEMFGGDAYKEYKAYKDNVDNKDALRKEYDDLYNTKIGNKSDAEVDRQAELKKLLDDIEDGTTFKNLRSKLSDAVFGTIKGSRLVNSYIDSENRLKVYADDATKQTNKYAKTTIENAIKSGVVNNSNRAHEMTETLSKISSDQNVVYDYVNDKIIAEQGRQKQRKVTKTFTADGKTAEFSLNTKRMDSNVKPVVKVGNTVVENYTVDYETGNIVFDSAPKKGKITVDYGAFDRINGWIETLEDGTKKITLNMDSNEVWQFTTGHEITHKLEGTKKYSKFREVLYQYAKDKGDYDGLMESVKKRYEEGTDYDSELTADLVGRYLFQDEDFVKHLSVNHRNVFQWLWDEVKHLSKLVTAGSKEARQLEKVKHAFEEAYRAGGKANANTGTQYSISQNLDSDLDSVLNGTFDASKNEVYLGETSNFMTDVIGAESLSLYMPASKAYSSMVTKEEYDKNPYYKEQENYHGIEKQDFIEILEKSENPIAAFANRPNEKGNKRQNRIVLVTDKLIRDIETGQECYAVVVEEVDADANVNGGRMKANKTITVFPRSQILSDIADAMADGRLLDITKKGEQLLAGRRGTNPQAAIQETVLKKNIANFWANVKWKNGKTKKLSSSEAATLTPMQLQLQKAGLLDQSGQPKVDSDGNRQFSISDSDGNQAPTPNPDIRFSISKWDDQPTKYGNFATPMSEVRYEAPTQEEVAPVQEVAEEAATPAPVAPVQAELPDEYNSLLQAKADLERRIMEAATEGNENEAQLVAEYKALTERINQIESDESAMQRDRFGSLTDEDVPPEMEAPYVEPQKPMQPDDPFYDRDIKEVGNRKVKAYMYENPEVKPFFQNEAASMLGDLHRTIKGERWYIDDLYYKSNGEYGWGGVKRHTTDDIAYLLDEFGYTYAEIEKGLNAIIEDNGAENNAVSKRIEFMLDERLRKGYTGVFGEPIPANQDYINLLNEKQILEYSDEARMNFMEHAEDYMPPATEDDIAPIPAFREVVSDNGVHENRGEVKGQQVMSQKSSGTGTTVGVEETAPMHEAKTEPKGTIKGQQMMWGGAGGTNDHVANVMVDEPQVEKKKFRAWSKFRTNFLDKFSVFEDLSLKHKNRELIGKANYMLSAESRAQRLIGNGDEFARVKSLNSIIEEVGNTGKTKQFFEYLYHMHNIDRMTLEERFKNVENKPVFGYSVTAKVSQETVEQLEKANPEFKQFAQDVYGFNKHLRNMLVENGVISSETAELWETMYPHFVPIRRLGDTGLNVNVPLDTGKTGVNAPIKRAKGGSRDIMNLFDTMAQRTIQTYKAVAKNNFGVELKNTLRSTITNENASIDEIIDSIDMQDGLLQEGKNGNSPTFTVFENGERVTFEITEDMYDALKPMSEGLAYTNKFANKVGNIHRGLLTEYNPTFLLTNAIKDAQDVLINSQHAAKTYATFPKALQEIVRKGEWYNEYLNNGGEQNTYFDKETNTFKSEERRGLGKVIGIPLDTIGKLNNAVEMLPRLAEYIASREDGRSVEVSMLDAARVTTNFAAGGDITKLLNRNGFTFLNASVQGFNQQVRNIREAKANGLKGWVQLAAKAAGAGLSALLLNHLLWDDDDDYEELSDYVKQNYYVVAKFGDGKFVRIPKGRTLAVIQNAFEQVSNALTGDDEVDLHSFLELAISNLAPNNPLENNIIAPIMQVAINKTWYGEDLVPTRLQDVPAAEQYDESTDSLSRWLGEVLDYSPYKINYLFNQYSGGIGDVFLPMMTPEAESGDDSLLGSFTAPLRDKFTTDSVMNNQNVSDFYDMKDKLTMNANSSKATDEDILKSKYFNAINSEMGKLYAEKREIQNSNLSDAVKYEQVRDIQKQIDSLARNSLNSYENVTTNGNYATVGDVHYRKDDNGTWQKINDDQLEKQEDVINHLGISETEYWSNKEEYDYAYKYPENYAIAKSVGGYTAYRTYASELYDIKADKDENGKSISGSRKDKVIDYVNNLDIDYGARLILFKSEYPSDDTYNYDIINYLEENDAISGEEMRTILTELGFHVSDDGTISWD